MNDGQFLSVMQLCDSSFPVGNFSHSFGLETYIQEGQVRDKRTMSEWLSVYFEGQMLKADGLGCRLACEAMEKGDIAAVFDVGRRLEAQSLARESREANRKIGMRFLQLAGGLFPDARLDAYRRHVQSGEASSHPALVFAMLGRHLQLSKYETLLAYLYSTASGLIQNAVRGIPLGQTAGQMLLHEAAGRFGALAERILELDSDELGATPPGLEIAQMRHEQLTVRIFMS